jgi:hypothetical protein
MATVLDFKRLVKDFVKLEGEATIALGTTGFAGDGDRMFLQWNEVGLLFSHDDARAFLRAAARVAARLDDDADDRPEGAFDA